MMRLITFAILFATDMYLVKFLDDASMEIKEREDIVAELEDVVEGDMVMCKWSDGKDYEAEIIKISGESCISYSYTCILKKTPTVVTSRPFLLHCEFFLTSYSQLMYNPSK